MGKEKRNHPQSQEEMIKAAQEEAVRAAIEEAQSMFANIPRFPMPDMEAMQAEMLEQMGVTPGQAWETAFDADWEIRRAGNGRLDAEQLRLLAFGAPLLVYNDEKVDTIDSEIDTGIIRTQLESWWEVTDGPSALGIVEWLLKEGHHAEADEALKVLYETGWADRPDDEEEEGESKWNDVVLIVKSMLENGWCTADTIPPTAMAWDLVRMVNLGRWAFLCGFIPEDRMWEVMKRAAEVATRHFDSWEAYGLSFVLGRGVWHGDPDDSETAHEIVSLLLEKEESPWRQLAWEG